MTFATGYWPVGQKSCRRESLQQWLSARLCSVSYRASLLHGMQCAIKAWECRTLLPDLPRRLARFLRRAPSLALLASHCAGQQLCALPIGAGARGTGRGVVDAVEGTAGWLPDYFDSFWRVFRASVPGQALSCRSLSKPTGFSTGADEHQVAGITHIAAVLEGPVVVMGDLNSSDQSPGWATLTRALKDAYRDAGWDSGLLSSFVQY